MLFRSQIEAMGHDAESIEAARIRALCSFLECEPEELTEGYRDGMLEHGNREYLVLTDAEADAACVEHIKESAWAFNASFLAGFTGLPETVFEALQPQCEGCNDAVLALIEKGGTIEDFAREAVAADGRGHFLSSYDGNENEQRDGEGETFYIYRVN